MAEYISTLFRQYVRNTRSRRTEATNRNLEHKLTAVAQGLKALRVVKLSQVNPMTFQRLIEGFKERGLSEHSVYSYGATARGFFNWCIRRHKLEVDRAGELRLCEPQQKQKRHLEKDEISELLLSLHDSHLLLPTVIALYQGLRVSEVANLRVEDVNRSAGEITIHRSKNKTWRSLKMHHSLAAYIPQTFPPSQEYLCLNLKGKSWTKDTLSQAFRTHLRRMGGTWPEISFHSLRHTCASQMAMSGKQTLFQIGRFLGHKTVAVTARYAHLMPNQVVPDW